MKTEILFDNDGVLVDTEHWYFTASAEILSSMGLTLDPRRYREIMIHGQSAFLIAEEAGFSQREIDAARDRRNLLYQHFLRTEEITIPGVPEVLRQLSETCIMGIVTSARREDFELIHSGRGLIDHMRFVLCSGEYPRAKPHPDPYLLGLEKLGGNRDTALVVEDSERGLRSAVAAGIDCAIVYNPFTVHHDFTRATHRIDTLEALLELL